MSYRLQDGEPLIILIFVYWRWHLTALTVPTLAVIKHLDALNSIAAGFFPRSVGLFLYPLPFQ
ncbi:hypothetical protein H2241_07320 [Pantoea ananatis]|nr:hypothetical protein [Pantoea ananatis]QKV89223.1 hypothetical protein FOB88_19825 [Pantoea ananatis]